MKTTIIGILTIVLAIGNAALAFAKGGHVDLAATAAAVTAGWGLLHASDAPKSPSGLKCHPLAVIASAGMAVLAMGGLSSCSVTTSPDGTVTKKPDTESIAQGFSIAQWGWSVWQTLRPPKADPVEPPEVIPAK